MNTTKNTVNGNKEDRKVQCGNKMKPIGKKKEQRTRHIVNAGRRIKRTKGKKRKAKHEHAMSVGNQKIQKVRSEKMNNYTIVKKMADALYGDVLLAKDTSCGTYVAIKRVNWECAALKTTKKDSISVAKDAVLEWEVNKLLSAHGGHQNVLRMQDSFEEDNKLHLVFDYCSKGDLWGIMQKEETLSESRALKYAYQILLGLEHMYRNGVAHRDLSLENVLVNDNDECQICDFGLVASIPSIRSERVGKTVYMAPEVSASMPYNPIKADSWSLGIILFAMLTNNFPFAETFPQDEVFQYLTQHSFKALAQIWGLDSSISPATLDLLDTLLNINSYERSSVTAALNHPAFNGIVERSHFLPGINERMQNQRAQCIIAPVQEERHVNEAQYQMLPSVIDMIHNIEAVQCLPLRENEPNQTQTLPSVFEMIYNIKAQCLPPHGRLDGPRLQLGKYCHNGTQ